MRKTVLAAAGALAVASGAITSKASAADLDYIPPPTLAPIWQGFHIGGHLGFGEADMDGSLEADIVEVDPDIDGSYSFRKSFTPDGLIGGAQAGYDWQFNALVLGLEGDISFADWRQKDTLFEQPLDDLGTAIGTASAEVDMLATIRGRLGMGFGNVLVYGTGGVAWADATAKAKLVHDDGVDEDTVLSAKESFDDIGFVAGGGLSWMVVPDSFSVGIEGLYYWFDEDKTVEETFELAEGEVNVRARASLDDAWVVRGRADFHF